MSVALSNRQIEGWLIKYGLPSVPLSLANGRSVVEVIQPGAFARSVDAINRGEATIEANIEHGKDNAIMRLGTTDINVKVENRAEGVYGFITFINDNISADIFERVKTGLVQGLSVQFTLPDGVEPAYQAVGGNYVRSIADANLTGFAVTAKPAYPDAKIVAATEFSRSIAAAETEAIAREVAKFEAIAREQEYHRRSLEFC